MTQKPVSAQRGRTSPPTIRGWLPNQHGAWPMLIVPFIVGTVLSYRAEHQLAPWIAPLLVAEFAGYFAFSAFSVFSRQTPRHRPAFKKPIIVYYVITALAAVAVIALGGWRLASWAPAAFLLAGWALWKTSKRQERSVSSGLAEAGLAVGLGIAIRFPHALDVLTLRVFQEGSIGSSAYADLAVLLAVFGYFGGTILHVKSLIREWGKPASRRQSLIWHAAWLAVNVIATALGLVSWPWPIFFAVCLIRSWIMSDSSKGRRPKVRKVGALEMILSLAVLIIALIG